MIRLCITALCFWSLGAVPMLLSSDKLYPVDLTHHATYRNILAGKLCQTRFSYGRAVFLPSFTPEASVSVYAEVRENLRVDYVVSYRETEANMFQATQASRFPGKADRIKIHRIDASISKQLAELLGQAWSSMVQPDRLMTT